MMIVLDDPRQKVREPVSMVPICVCFVSLPWAYHTLMQEIPRLVRLPTSSLWYARPNSTPNSTDDNDPGHDWYLGNKEVHELVSHVLPKLGGLAIHPR